VFIHGRLNRDPRDWFVAEIDKTLRVDTLNINPIDNNDINSIYICDGGTKRAPLHIEPSELVNATLRYRSTLS
jgi:hypothetical protein